MDIPVTTVTITPAGINNVVNVVVGDTQTFNCSTGLSRPAAWIQWYIGGYNMTDQAEPQTPQPDGDKFISSSRLVYTGKDDNHNKTIYCEAVNIEGRDKVKSTEITINVELPVTTVTITPAGINNVVNVVVGATRTFNCSTGLSRPAAWIQWYIGGYNMTDQAEPQTPQPDGDKFISSSRLVYTGKDENHNKTIYCETVNIDGRDKVKSREITIYVKVPVTTVTITPAGISNVVNVVVGATRTFNCSTGLSRPAAWIQWYIGGENVTNQAQPQTPLQDGDKIISSSRLVYIGEDEDNNKTIFCETVNIEGQDKVKSREISIYIQIPVTTVTITPAGINNVVNVLVGDTQTFNCSTGLSRPAAWIQW
ncbi:nephrin-like [Mytilus galloprovincialis]|uniref:nephrin-like n=1 Tax=Mytilus galloprovincialis TaxID=29158 RepID=UPI003F7C0E93